MSAKGAARSRRLTIAVLGLASLALYGGSAVASVPRRERSPHAARELGIHDEGQPARSCAPPARCCSTKGASAAAFPAPSRSASSTTANRTSARSFTITGSGGSITANGAACSRARPTRPRASGADDDHRWHRPLRATFTEAANCSVSSTAAAMR